MGTKEASRQVRMRGKKEGEEGRGGGGGREGRKTGTEHNLPVQWHEKQLPFSTPVNSLPLIPSA